MKKYENFCAALRARNNVAHTYNRLVALDIVEQTKSRFNDMFVTLKDEMEANWI
ncbi:MAG: nucleotidyltransferase substrate binding protein [Clostridiales bacterium]|nr:nucleotidyltransferase substrate binding protein [Clostridiales bacterium]